MLGIPFRTISQKRETLGISFHFEPFSERKTVGNSFQSKPFKDKAKHSDDFKKTFFREILFSSVQNI
jgi:hypothetical protein